MPTLISRKIAVTALMALLAISAFALNSRKDAPKFRAKSISGEQFNNESLKGKPVLIQFWATWCRYCRRDEPVLEDLGKEFAGKLTILTVDIGESKRKVQDYLAKNPRSFPVVLTGDTNLGAVMEATAYPKYVLLDEDGKMAGEQTGSGGEASLRHLLKEVSLVGKAPDADFVLEGSPAK